MFIVEDITEFQKLEEEMEKQKEEEMKNLEVLQELPQTKKRTLLIFQGIDQSGKSNFGRK